MTQCKYITNGNYCMMPTYCFTQRFCQRHYIYIEKVHQRKLLYLCCYNQTEDLNGFRCQNKTYSMNKFCGNCYSVNRDNILSTSLKMRSTRRYVNRERSSERFANREQNLGASEQINTNFNLHIETELRDLKIMVASLINTRVEDFLQSINNQKQIK